MKSVIQAICLAALLVHFQPVQAQSAKISLSEYKDLEFVNVQATPGEYMEKKCLRVTGHGEASEASFVKLGNMDLRNGAMEIELAGKPAEGAGRGARGFVGIAFRISGDNEKFECFYLRPTNGRAEDQLRRNHSVQYISYPDFPWYTLREETPGKYETYVDLVPGQWTKVRIEFSEERARLYVHGNSQPTLIVNDLKHGADSQGSIGLWIGPGTEAYFSDLRIIRRD